MSKNAKLQPVPMANPSLPVLTEDLAKSLFTGQPLPEESTALARQVVANFVEKSTLINMVTIAEQLKDMGRLMAGMANVSDIIYDHGWLEGACNDPKMAHDFYKLFNETLRKRIKLSHDFNKDMTMALDRGMDPEKHLHLHLHTPVSEVEYAEDIRNNLDKQKHVSRAFERVIDIVAEKKNPHPRRSRPSRLLDHDDPDAAPKQ